MNLESLRTFLAIIETGSLARAATALNVTQSTVTTRLKTLEQDMGQRLINRQRSGAQLTGAGLRLQRYAQTIEELWRQARQDTAVPAGVNAVCNLGCDPDLWTGLGQGLFNTIRLNQPSVALSIWQGESASLGSWMDQGRIDLALSYAPTNSSGKQVISLPAEDLLLHSTTPDSPITGDPGYVFVEAGETFGKDHAAAYAAADTARLSFGSATLGLAHILEEGGAAYLPQRLAAAHVSTGQLFPRLEAPHFQRSAYLLVNEASTKGWPWFSDALTILNL